MKVGIAQFAPVYLDLKKSLEKMEAIIESAAKEGVNLLVFGETWLCGYPSWLDSCQDMNIWNNPTPKKMYAKTLASGIQVPGKETELIAKWCRNYNINISIGVNEKTEQDTGSLYNSLLFFDITGQLVIHHRKLNPTFTEKLIHVQGDGLGLITTDIHHAKVGGLICWEHWMPMARQALHDSGEHVHVAVWPEVHDLHLMASRHYAFESKSYVIAAGQLLRYEDMPEELPIIEKFQPGDYILKGGSCIIGPDSNLITDQVFEKEQLITAELDMENVMAEKMYLDTGGHYSRKDVFFFEVKRG